MSDLTGAYVLNAEVSDTSGWKRTLDLGAPARFAGNKFNASATLDLSQVQKIIDALEKQTGIRRPEYLITFVPKVNVQGTVAGEDWQGEFSPRLTFRLDNLELRLWKDDPSKDPFKPAQTLTLKRTRSESNLITFAGFSFPILLVRAVAGLGLAAALIGLAAIELWNWWLMRSRIRRVQFRYGSLMMPTRVDFAPPTDCLVHVASLDDLARLATKESRLIMHRTQDQLNEYFLPCENATYWYSLEL